MFFLPKGQKVQFLKLNKEIQIKYKNEVYYLKKGDSIFFNEIKIICKDISFVEVNAFDNIKMIDFNVNNYKSLILEL
tara:strand:- start:474 stop:704 length:231 start_codon:yes stop_codon:yes gene_type:complete